MNAELRIGASLPREQEPWKALLQERSKIRPEAETYSETWPWQHRKATPQGSEQSYGILRGPPPYHTPTSPQTLRADAASGETHRRKRAEGKDHHIPQNGHPETGLRGWRGRLTSAWHLCTWLSLCLQETRHSGGQLAVDDLGDEVTSLRRVLTSITEV